VWARPELEEVSRYFADSESLYEKEATKAALVSAATGATNVHLSCHGLYKTGEPLGSLLALAGRDLTLAEILADPPFSAARLVVASACQTAITDYHRLPEEAIGLPAGFLQSGVPGVVGTLWSVDDLSTAVLMERFYHYLLDVPPRDSTCPVPPAEALRQAQQWVRELTAGQLRDHLLCHSFFASAWEREEACGARLPDDPEALPFAAPYYWAGFVCVGV
jgi:CHAT domain-containing protein